MGKLFVVHCIDTEGPLTESIEATFVRLRDVFGINMAPSVQTLGKLQRCELDVGGREQEVARMVSPDLLAYNSSWEEISVMLTDAMSQNFRNEMLDHDGNGWVFSWHCVDHVGLAENPRSKELGYGKVFRFYKQFLENTASDRDELNWHFHPLAITKNATSPATSFSNNYGLLNEIICRRILEDKWFPIVNRPGFHSTRPDSHLFLEQWMPFDFGNQYHESIETQPDLSGGRFGDWRRAPSTWRGYRPSHEDYQLPGSCKRVIFRCLNVGTRLRTLDDNHVRQAFQEASEFGSAILAFADHDYRDIRPDVRHVRKMLADSSPDFPDVSIHFMGAEAAARAHLKLNKMAAPKLSLSLNGNRLDVKLIEGEIFGPQPFLALLARDGRVFHDNLDFEDPGQYWSYTFDSQTIEHTSLKRIGVGAAGRYGLFDVVNLDLQ